jgi:mannose/fructose-specific phosphotransferase system component IIA
MKKRLCFFQRDRQCNIITYLLWIVPQQKVAVIKDLQQGQEINCLFFKVADVVQSLSIFSISLLGGSSYSLASTRRAPTTRVEVFAACAVALLLSFVSFTGMESKHIELPQ